MGLEEQELRAWVQRVATGEANRRHEGLRRLAGRLRTADLRQSRWGTYPNSGGGDPQRGEWWPRAGWYLDNLAPQTGGGLARRRTLGIMEAVDMYHRLYGIDRLCTVLSRHWAGTAQDIQAAVMADVRGHIGDQKVYDDITLVVAKQR